MSWWPSSHSQLHDALWADRIAPHLLRGLAGGLADEVYLPAGVQRDWVVSLRESPGWALLSRFICLPEAFQEAWERATDLGWSPRALHHNALIFEQLTLACFRHDQYDQARWAWQRCLDSWLGVTGSAHFEQRVSVLGENASPSAVRKAKERLIWPAIDPLCDMLDASVGVDAPHLPMPNRARARSLLAALKPLLEFDEHDQAHALGQVERARARIATTRRHVADGLARRLDQLELIEADHDAIADPVDEAFARLNMLGLDDACALTLARSVVNLIWALRRLEGPSREPLIMRILQYMEPATARLVDATSSGRELSWASLVADLLVFDSQRDGRDPQPGADCAEAPRTTDTLQAREPRLQRALAICPGHRNASMMLAYIRLSQARDVLERLKLVPAALARIPAARRRLRRELDAALALVDEAAGLYPCHDDLPTYRDDLAALTRRFQFPGDPPARPDHD